MDEGTQNYSLDHKLTRTNPSVLVDKPNLLEMDKSEEEETAKDKDTHTTSHDVPEDTSVLHLSTPKLAQIQELMAQFLDLPSQVSLVQGKLKTLDSLPSLLNKVTDTLNRFSTVVETASGALSKNVPSAG
ncbi:hypothetical protein Tco_1197076 [Tanacetum coccineum]